MVKVPLFLGSSYTTAQFLEGSSQVWVTAPRWPCEQVRSDEAAKILARLQVNQPADESTPEVVLLRHQIEISIELESTGGLFKYKDVLGSGKVQNFRRMVLSGLVNIIQQQFTGEPQKPMYTRSNANTIAGRNMINYHAHVVYQHEMHLPPNLSLILGGCTSLTYLVASIIPL